MTNPYTAKLEKARQKLAKVEGQQKSLDANAIPGTFITGRSGVSAARSKRLDRQLDKTIDLAVAYRKALEQVQRLERLEKLYEQGKVNGQGRAIWPKKKKKKGKPWTEQRRTLYNALEMLSIDGVYCVKGHKLEVLAKWNEEVGELEGFVRVTDPDGEETLYLAESIQGVHLEALETDIIKALLEV